MINSPCKKVCKINIKNGLCLGCDRNLDEIKDWYKFDDIKKKEILIKTNKRRQLYLKQENNFILHSNKNLIL